MAFEKTDAAFLQVKPKIMRNYFRLATINRLWMNSRDIPRADANQNRYIYIYIYILRLGYHRMMMFYDIYIYIIGLV